ncbi:MAG: hypothetical protein AAB116_26945 [Candidatus Poribacteria bacterium]
MEKDAQFYRKDARNILILVGFIAFLPTLAFLIIKYSDSASSIKWDAVTFGIIFYSIIVATLAFYAAIKCGSGKKIGRNLAFIPSILILLNFPLGTIFGIAALVKINKKKFIELLI